MPKIRELRACMLDKENYLKKYNLKEIFEKSELDWNVLEEIYDDYCIYKDDLEKVCERLETYLIDSIKDVCSGVSSYHSLRGRVKDAEHLIEKIIRKRGIEHNHKYDGISKDNYRSIVRDLIGIRLLIFKKEEWEQIFDFMSRMFVPMDSDLSDNCMAERPVAYTRYGDRDIYKNKIHVEHSNKGYRSQHYIIKFGGAYCEVQVRTLSEEVYGEFDHRVRYPYRNDNKFLIRYTGTLSQLLDSVDELISTCEQLKDGWDECNRYYDDDKYIDWKHISMKSEHSIESENTEEYANLPDKICAKEFMCDSLLRKEML